MRHIFYLLFIVGILLGNNDLDSYLTNKKLQHQIIKDEKNQIIIIDLLDTENKMMVFSKNETDYKKTFDERLYFCKSNNIVWFQNIYFKNDNYIISCFSNYVDRGQRDISLYFNYKNLKLVKITREDGDQEGVLRASYQFIPEVNIPILSDFKSKSFADNYLSKNYKNFIKINSLNEKQILPDKQPLYKTPPIKTKMYLIKGDKVEILEEKDDWLYILYKGKKEIKAWILKSAVE